MDDNRKYFGINEHENTILINFMAKAVLRGKCVALKHILNWRSQIN